MNPKLYMVLLGARPLGRHIEQHDIYFGIANTLSDLIPDIKAHWPETKGIIHIDSWREVNCVNGHTILVRDKATFDYLGHFPENNLFFINLGGYKPNDLEEYHYKLLVCAKNKTEAIKLAKQTAFFKHTGFVHDGTEEATAHIDDKFGIDVDDIHEIKEILSSHFKENYSIQIINNNNINEDALHIGYIKL